MAVCELDKLDCVFGGGEYGCLHLVSELASVIKPSYGYAKSATPVATA